MGKHVLRIMTASALLAFGLAACGSGSGGSGSSANIQIWEGYTQVEAKAFAHLLKEWNAKHPDEKVTSSFVNNDYSLPKLLTAVKGGSQPDIAYVYGSWAPNVAQIPQVVNLTKVVQQPGVNWNDFWIGERDVATVNGKVIGIPALVDNLAVVYNKTLFAKAHLPLPSANWTWNDFVTDAQKLTDAGDQAVRHRLRDARRRGHGVALGGAAVGGRRRRSSTPATPRRPSTQPPGCSP